MNIGQLFVSLGVKGANKSIAAVTGVKTSLVDTATAGLQAKAAILATGYALSSLIARSGQVGTGLTNFNATIGVTSQKLQQYQHAARQVGASNESVENSFRGLQSTITKQLLGIGQAPTGLAEVARKMASIGIGMSPHSLAEFANEPDKLLQVLQKYAQLEQHAGLRNEVLSSFGLDAQMVAAVTRNAFRPEVLARADVYSKGEVAALDRANVAVSNLENKISMQFGRFVAEYGPTIIGDMTKLTDSVFKLADAFMALNKEAGIFTWLGKSVDGWTSIMDSTTSVLNGDLADATSNLAKEYYGDDSFFNQLKAVGRVFFGGDENDETPDKNTNVNPPRELGGAVKPPRAAPSAPAIAPPAMPRAPGVQQAPGQPTQQNPPLPPGGINQSAVRGVPPVVSPVNVVMPRQTPNVANSTKTTNFTVNQTLNFEGGGKDAAAVGDSVRRATQTAYRQLSSTSRGT